MELIRDIDRDQAKQKIVKSMLGLMADLGIQAICEGVETQDELETLEDLGATLIQGYVLARPAFESLVGADALAPMQARRVA